MNNIELRIIEIYNNMLAQRVDENIGISSQNILDAPLNDLSLDSLEHMDLVLQIEDSFNLLLDESEVLKCKSLSELAALVESTI